MAVTSENGRGKNTKEISARNLIDVSFKLDRTLELTQDEKNFLDALKMIIGARFVSRNETKRDSFFPHKISIRIFDYQIDGERSCKAGRRKKC